MDRVHCVECCSPAAFVRSDEKLVMLRPAVAKYTFLFMCSVADVDITESSLDEMILCLVLGTLVS